MAGVLVAVWLGFSLVAAASGKSSYETRPPTMLLDLAAMLAIACGIVFSSLGARPATGLPLAALVGFQVFRLPLELMMHRAYEIGLMSVQMSSSGLNFEIVTGITALVTAGLISAGRLPRDGVVLWNLMGFALLANAVTIAMLSAPTPFRVFMSEPANVWVTQAPWVWLPGVMVPMALLGHILVFRRLRVERAAAESRVAVPGVPGA